MIAALLEFIVSFLLEFILEAVVEGAAELGIHSLGRTWESRTAGPILRVLIYAVIGAILGFASTFLIAVRVIDSSTLRIVLMILSPLSMGLMLCLTSWFLYRKDRHEPFWSTEKFVTGAIFGAAYSVSRAAFVDGP